MSTTIEDLLAQVRATPISEVQHAGRRGAGPAAQTSIPGCRRILTSDQAAAYCADILAAAWQALLEPEWPTLRAILERDVIYRAGQLTSKGWAAALDGLHPNLAWQPGRIELTRWPGQRGRRPGAAAGCCSCPRSSSGPGSRWAWIRPGRRR